MQMRYLITQGCEVDLVGILYVSQSPLDSTNDVEQMLARFGREVGHLSNMCAPNDPAITGIVGIAGINHSAVRIGPEN